VYLPVEDRKQARKVALAHVVRTFFEGSAAAAAAALIESQRDAMDDETLDRLAELIEQARTEER
jgi:predicted transcriptional regulator